MKEIFLTIISFLLFVTISFGQKLHCYELAVIPFQEYNGQVFVPLKADIDISQIKKVFIQYRFFENNTFDFIANGNKSNIKYEYRNNNVIVKVNDIKYLLIYKNNPEIPNEVMIIQYKYGSPDDLKGSDLMIYYCQVLK